MRAIKGYPKKMRKKTKTMLFDWLVYIATAVIIIFAVAKFIEIGNLYIW